MSGFYECRVELYFDALCRRFKMSPQRKKGFAERKKRASRLNTSNRLSGQNCRYCFPCVFIWTVRHYRLGVHRDDRFGIQLESHKIGYNVEFLVVINLCRIDITIRRQLHFFH